VKIKRQSFKIIIISIVIGMLCGSYVLYDKYVNSTKHEFRTKIINNMQVFLSQQQAILRQLSQSILDPVKNQDVTTIVAKIRAYEDVIFTISKSGLGIPVRIHFVSLSAPQLILGSSGRLNNNSLAPDEAYYLSIMSNPNTINMSRSYEQLAMPGFLFCNLGLGVLEHGTGFYGQLDAQLSLNALHDYLAANNLQNTKLFSFKLNTNNITQPDIVVNRRIYLYGLFIVWSAVVVSILLVVGISRLVYLLYCKYKHQHHELLIVSENLSKLITDKNIMQSSRQVQYKYGILAANDSNEESLIDIQQILQDAYAVNAEDAAARGIKIDFPASLNNYLKFYGNRLRLMQILSGIIGEGINVLPGNSVIKLQVEISQVQYNLHQVIFKLQDNGFYSKLEHRHVLVSSADVRVQGWDNINYLIDLELGELQYVHTAYTGNTLIFSITRKLEQKVFNIENYS
jgi:hypothetical protein